MEKEIELTHEGRGFWHLVAEMDLYEMVEKSGFGEKEFVLFQKRRLRNALLASLTALMPAYFINPWFLAIGPFFFVYSWRMAYTKEKLEYQDLVFEKQIEWNSFERLSVMYLKREGISIYEVSRKLLDRLAVSEFKTHLHRFMIEIIDKPDDIAPFIKFAQNASGTEAAMTFMTSLYNYRNHANDGSIINELSEMSRNQMKRGMHEISNIKTKRFYHYPTKLAMLLVLPMFGYMIGVAVHVFTNNMNI